MNYIDEIFLRADIQQVRKFLLCGTEASGVDPRPYKVRVDSAIKSLTSKLHERYPEEEDFEEITGVAYECMGAFEDVYMEIGLQLGAVLAAQVCKNLTAAHGGE